MAGTAAAVKEDTFADRMAKMIVKAITDRKSIDARKKADEDFIQYAAGDLWAMTKSLIRQRVMDINEKLPVDKRILQWEPDRSDTVMVTAILSDKKILSAEFNEWEKQLRYTVKGTQQNNFLKVGAQLKDGERTACWVSTAESKQGEEREQYTAGQVAEKLMEHLVENI